MWAALLACVREALNDKFNGNVPVYFFNDFVYAVGNTAAFRDIVGGRRFTFDPQQGLVPGALSPLATTAAPRLTGITRKKASISARAGAAPTVKSC